MYKLYQYNQRIELMLPQNSAEYDYLIKEKYSMKMTASFEDVEKYSSYISATVL